MSHVSIILDELGPSCRNGLHHNFVWLDLWNEIGLVSFHGGAAFLDFGQFYPINTGSRRIFSVALGLFRWGVDIAEVDELRCYGFLF